MIGVSTVAANARPYREALVNMIAGVEPDFFLSLAFNRDITPAGAEANLRHLFAMLDRETIGPKWQRRESRRAGYVALIENPHRNLHLHAAVCVAPEYRDEFAALARRLWPRCTTRGSLDVQPVLDAMGVAAYITKQISPAESDRIIISETMRARVRRS